MSRMLRIEWIELRDRRGWQDPYDLDGCLVGIVGPIDRGKTSMTECIDYLFGSSLKFRGAVDKHLLAVRARIRIGDGTFILHRKRSNSAIVRIQDLSGTPIGDFPMKSVGDQPSLSDWLLAQLGLDDAFASVRLPGGDALNFATDLLPYLHIRQEDIDRFIVRPGADDNARLSVLTLLLHLRSPALERLAATITELHNEIRGLQRKTKAIADFLAGADATNADALDADLARLREEEEEAATRYRNLVGNAQAATRFAEQLHEQLEKARERLSRAEDGVDWALGRHREAKNKITALEKSLSVLEAGPHPPDDGERLGLRYEDCAACGTDLTERIVRPGHCSMCTLPLPGVSAHAQERAHLLVAKEAAQQSLAQAEQDLGSARDAARSAREHHKKARQALDERTEEAVTPYVDALVAASTDLETIRSKILALQRLRSPHLRLTDRYTEIAEKEAELEARRSEQNRLLAELRKPDDVLHRLDSLFRQIVKAFELPWATGRARLDGETFTPMVDEQDFDQRGGGSRTAVSVAYSLALLMYALEDPARFHLPTLLILDSPQKNFGRNEVDQKLATRIYNWIIDYFETRRAALGRRYDTFQLIIVDNNIPTAVRSGFNKIVTFKDESGLIRDLNNPHGTPILPAQQLELDEEETADDL